MAGKSNTSATFFAQKKLLGKAHTSNLKVDGEEEIGSNIQSSTSLLFGEAIPIEPTRTLYTLQSASLNDAPTVEYVEFKLNVLTGTTYDADQTGGGGGDDSGENLQSSGPHTYKFALPGEYELSSSNARKGNGVFNDNQIIHQTLGSLQIIPPFYSQAAPNPYIVKLYQDDGGGGVGTEISLLDNTDWNVDYYNGILFIQDYDASKIPAFARCFAYIGKMASEVIASGSGGGGSGPGDADATFLTLTSTGSLNNERVFTPSTGLTGVDAGANNNYTLSIDNSIVATLSGSTFTGVSNFNLGLSGSLTQLIDGSSYLVAGSNVTIASESNGQITISSTGGGGGGTPGGSDTQIQFNDGGSFGGDSGLTFNKTTNVLSTIGGVSGSITQLIDGRSYIAAGSNISITSESNGQITITSTASGGGAGGATSRNKEIYVLTGSHAQDNDLFLNETDFSVSTYDPDLIDVYLNGVLLVSGTQIDVTNDDADYSVVETNRLRFAFDLDLGDKLNVKTFNSGSDNTAPADALYLTLAANATLTNERVLTAGNNIIFNDTGANGTLTVATTAVSSSMQSYELTGTLPANTGVDTVVLDTSLWDANGYDVFVNGVMQRSGSAILHDIYRDSSSLKLSYELLLGDFIYLRKFS